MSRIRSTWATVLLLGLLVPATSAAKPATLTGTVTDTDGQALADVQVVARDQQNGSEVSGVTDAAGKFELRLAKPEHGFIVSLSKAGYRSYEHPVELRAGTALDSDWILLREEEALARDAEAARIETRNQAAELFNQGADLYDEQNYDAAVEKFNAALAVDDSYAPALAGLARARLKQEQFQTALELVGRYRELEPDAPRGLRMWYDALWGLGQTESAAEVLYRLVEADPGPTTAARCFNHAVAAMKADDLPTARKLFERAVEMDDSLHDALLTLARIHQAGGEPELALARIDQYLAAQPADLPARLLRYRLLHDLGRQDAATASLAELQSTGHAAEAVRTFHRDGVDLFNDGGVAEALTHFEAALVVDPDHARSLYMKGLCLVNLGQEEDGRAALERFLALTPDDPDTATARELLSYLDK